jgi:hypothetical protein
MTPQEVARVDQLRAGFTEALATPCQCGDCPSDQQMRDLLALDDETLLVLIHEGGGTP